MARAGDRYYDVQEARWKVRTMGRGGRVVDADSPEGREAQQERAALDELAAEERTRRRDQAARDAADRGYTSPASEPAQPAGETPTPSRISSRRRAAAALAETGVRRSRRAAAGTGRTARTARRRTQRAVYEAAGGSSLGQFVVFFFGSLIALVLFEDAISTKGSTGFTKATQVGTEIAKRIIEPVPIVSAPGS